MTAGEIWHIPFSISSQLRAVNRNVQFSTAYTSHECIDSMYWYAEIDAEKPNIIYSVIFILMANT